SPALDTLFGRSRSAFPSRVHARVGLRVIAIGRLRNSRTRRGVRKTARQVLLRRWHKPRMGIFGWEVTMVRIDSTVSSWSATSPQSGGPFPVGTVSSLLADLWIAFQPGAVSLLRNGNATNYTVSE